jgi:membrane protein DedA with SNARE-associated domain
VRRVLLVLACAGLVPLVPFAVLGELPGERWLSAQGGDALRFGATGAALLALDVLLPIPSSVLGALLGGRLGFVPGALWAFSGLFVGQCFGYALGRLLPARFASQLPVAADGMSAAVVLVSRPVPVLAEAVAIAAGVERMPLRRYLVAGGLGNAAYALAMAGSGAALLPEGLAGPGLAPPMLLPVAAWLLWQRLRARARPAG